MVRALEAEVAGLREVAPWQSYLSFCAYEIRLQCKALAEATERAALAEAALGRTENELEYTTGDFPRRAPRIKIGRPQTAHSRGPPRTIKAKHNNKFSKDYIQHILSSC